MTTVGVRFHQWTTTCITVNTFPSLHLPRRRLIYQHPVPDNRTAIINQPNNQQKNTQQSTNQPTNQSDDVNNQHTKPIKQRYKYNAVNICMVELWYKFRFVEKRETKWFNYISIPMLVSQRPACRSQKRFKLGQSWVRSTSKASVVTLNTKLYPYCLVQVWLGQGFKNRATINESLFTTLHIQ